MSKSLIIVEDDQPFRERLGRALEKRGFRVTACPNAASAWESVAAESHDGMVLDLNLPDEKGLKVLTRVRERQPDLAIVVLTGYGSIATAIEAVRLGARDYLTKPTDPDRILATMFGPPAVHAPPAPEAQFCVPSLGRVEWEHIQRVLAECGGNISQTARLLGIDRRSLQRKLAKYPPNQ